MSEEEPEPDSMEFIDDKSSIRRRAIGCCAIAIIIIFVAALIVGYTPWFRPFIP